MKRRTVAKALRVVLLLLVAALCVFCAFLAINDALRSDFARFVSEASFGVRVSVLCACIACLALLLVSCFLPLTGKKAPDLTLQSVQIGKVSISSAALEKMAEASVKNVAGIRDVRVFAATRNNQIAYRIKMNISQSASIPDLVQKMQSRVAQYVSERVGVPVCEVNIIVAGYVQDPNEAAIVKSRVK